MSTDNFIPLVVLKNKLLPGSSAHFLSGKSLSAEQEVREGLSNRAFDSSQTQTLVLSFPCTTQNKEKAGLWAKVTVARAWLWDPKQLPLAPANDSHGTDPFHVQLAFHSAAQPLAYIV